MRLDNEAHLWDSLGSLDPFWVILTDADKRFGRWDRNEFFQRGEEDIAAVLSTLETVGISFSGGRALDFGCGVGRLTRALAGRFDEALGVDISEEMVDRARSLNLDRPNVSFMVNKRDDLAELGDAQFDFILSLLVLQHTPSGKVAKGYLREFVRLLRPGGVVVFQLPSVIPWRRRLQPRRRLYKLLRRLGIGERFLYQGLRLFPVRMISVPEAEVVRVLRDAGARLVGIESTGDAGPDCKSRLYFAVKPSRAAEPEAPAAVLGREQ